jgi:outer membrane protein TolC
MKINSLWRGIIGVICLYVPVTLAAEAPQAAEKPATPALSEKQDLLRLDLNKCLEIAWQNNQRRPASQYALAAAEAQHKQALSAYWPTFSVKSIYTQLDESPNFIFPAKTIPVPGQTIPLPPPIGPVKLPPSSVNVPAQNVKLMDKHNLLTTVGVSYPVFAGGLRTSKVQQAKSGVEAAKQEVRRTDLQVAYDTRRMFYGLVLAKQLYQLGQDTLDRLTVTLELTESLYKRGSGKVKKTDYLRNKSATEGVRTLVAQLKGHRELAKAALVNNLGLDWQTPVEVASTEIPYQPYRAHLDELVTTSYRFNPDWAKLRAGLEAAEAKITEARSGHFPKVMLTGSFSNIANSFQEGIVTPNNRNAWALGAMVEFPLFEGFLTQNKIREARANLNKLEQDKLLLKEGIALQVQDLFIKLRQTQEQYKAAKDAAHAAEENRDLNERAYQNELVETKDVIEAQITESFLKATFNKAVYDHAEVQAHLSYVVGTEISKMLHLDGEPQTTSENKSR